VFAGTGAKYSEALEADIEALVADRTWATPSGQAGTVREANLTEAYLEHARAALNGGRPAHATRIAVDCANGATVTVAPRLLAELGFDLLTLGVDPTGRNINLDCGSTHPERLQRAVVEHGCSMGVAFDGDGDRAMFVDADGRLVDGDAVMFICARQMLARGTLRGNTVAATVMSNIGLEIALRAIGVTMLRCPVGDKYVMEEMVRQGLSLGGEQSGHIIFMDTLFTGDGLVTALNVLRVMGETGLSLAELSAGLRTFPQVLVNVRVRERRDWKTVPAVADAVADVEQKLGGRGRLLIRYSGTEPLMRIMIEGEHHGEINDWARDIAEAVTRELGQS
ncbi:MAG: phosphoglucosamine mutase, partial [Vicinamibacterales bacterium]|nr:phosphoglucosamine mutase [Vicinamibacterales bacterium]